MAEINIPDLKPNSHKYNASESLGIERKKIKPVIEKNMIVRTKKTIGQKFLDVFFDIDFKDLKVFFIQDILLPGGYDLASEFLEMIFDRGGDRRRRGGRSGVRRYDDYVSYSSYYGNPRERFHRKRNDEQKDRKFEVEKDLDYRNIILIERRSAEAVVRELRDIIREFGSASISDFFQLVDIQSHYMNNNWGWTDENDIGIKRVNDGYLIDVAEAIYIG